MIDVQELIGKVAARHGLRLDADDPALCLVTLNQLALEEAVEALVTQIRTASGEFEEATERLHRRTGVALAAALRDQMRSPGSAGQPGPSRSSERERRRRTFRAVKNGLLGLALFALGMLIGRLMGPC